MVLESLRRASPLSQEFLREPCQKALQDLLLVLESPALQVTLRESLKRISRVLEAPLPKQPFLVELVPLPREKLPPKGALRSQSLGSMQVVELALPANPLKDLDVVVHEASHALFRKSRAFPRLLEELRSLDPAASVLLADSLLEEALATVMGVEAGRALGSPVGLRWYQDASIDRLAKALAPLVRSYLRRGRSLDPGFARLTRGIFRRLWPQAERRVDMAFGQATLVTGALDPFRGMADLRRTLGTHSLWLAPCPAPGKELHPEALQGWAVVLTLNPGEVRTWGQSAPAWDPTKGHATWVRHDPSGKWILLLVGRSSQEIEELLVKLESREHLPREAGSWHCFDYQDP
jgi:hypothetical protein